MTTTTQKLDDIEHKVRQLGIKLEQRNKENIALRAELAEQQTKFDKLTKKLEHTQDTLESEAGNQTEDLTELRQKIDRYIEEIDKCIKWLHQT